MDDGRPVAAKTGTTQEFRDAWTVGFTPQISVGVWAGNNNNNPMRAGSDGVFVAAPIWHDFMAQVLIGKPVEQFIAYDDVKNNGELANSDAAMQLQQVITYYNNKTGKKISEKKAQKTDPKKVDKVVQYLPADASQNSPSGNSGIFSIAMPSPNDPMYQRWAGQLSNQNNSQAMN
jgi:penicillin-binding protein 1A